MTSSRVRPLLALCAGALLTLTAVPAAALDTTGTATPVTGNATWFTALGSPYGGCGLPQSVLDTQNFVALNVYNTPGDYAFYPRPLTGANLARMGMWNNGHNCGRWVRVTIGDNCSGLNDGARNQPFCRNGAWVADGYVGATLDMIVADSCGDDNGWCRDDPYHLDLAQDALNKFLLDGAAVGDLYPSHWNNRHITWEFIPAPDYTGDIRIGFLQSAGSWWGAISVAHLPNGIHGVEYLQNGAWSAAEMNGDMGQSFVVKPLAVGGTDFQIRVRDVDDALIFGGRTYKFSLPDSCCSGPFTEVAYTTEGGTDTGVTLTVSKAGAGAAYGTVTSTPAGVSCGAACSGSFSPGTLVTLTATTTTVGTTSGVFAGWSGACTGTTATCTVTLSQAQTVTATFNALVVEYPALTVSKSGGATGTVASSSGGINCGSSCSAVYAPGTTVTLTAVAASGGTFAGWSGACTGSSSTCVVTMNASKAVTATFSACCAAGTRVDVNKAGTGSGTVTSTPAGLSCGSTCSNTYGASVTSVTLTAAAVSGSTFAGWSGDCSGTSTCVLSLNGTTRSVTATFVGSCAVSAGGTALPCATSLSVTRNGTGTVTSMPAGINCGTTCTSSFAPGATVTLTATAASGTTFAGWGGACAGTSTCVVYMDANKSVSATFSSCCAVSTVTVTKAGTGQGTVVSTPSGISCGSACSATYAAGAVVTLSAIAATGSTFTGWSGACTGTAPTCALTLTGTARTATATFEPPSPGPCANPVTFTGSSSNFDTAGAVCYRTSQTVNGWGCSNFAGRTVSVNGGSAASSCGAGPFPLPKLSDGYTYFSITAGTYPWTNLYVW